MSVYTKGEVSITVDFNIIFDLKGTPVLKIEDKSLEPSNESIDIKIIVTRPDGIVSRKLSDDGFDLSYTKDSGWNTYEYVLPLSSSDGKVSKGKYKIDYYFKTSLDNTLVVKKTKQYDFQFKDIVLTTFQDINEFTPVVKIKDTTPNYNITNFTLSSLSRTFSATNGKSGSSISDFITTGVTNADRTFDLKDTSSKYFDTDYTVILSVTRVYTDTTYNWVKVQELTKKSESLDVHKFPTITEMLAYFDALRNLVETYDGYNNALHEKYKKRYEFVISSWTHLTERISNVIIDDENTDIIRDILNVLREDIPRTHTGNELTAVDLSTFEKGTSWDKIRNIPTYNPFATKQESFSSSKTWEMIHSLNKKPSVTLVDEYENIVHGAVEYVNLNIIKITFNTLTSGKVYLN
tara:strand:- start:2067 stop:3287 length:1221 start_codon:yes stop_codon:yes gene_type:complete